MLNGDGIENGKKKQKNKTKTKQRRKKRNFSNRPN